MIALSIALVAAALAARAAAQAGSPQQQQEEFRCAAGRERRARASHTPSANGCGITGMIIDDCEPKLTECCNAHDLCYDTCGSKRSRCDKDFQTCLTAACKHLKNRARDRCKKQAQQFGSIGSLFGGMSFMQSQRNACECVKPAGAKSDL